MNNKRTGGMTAVAIINFVFAGGGVLTGILGIVAANHLLNSAKYIFGILYLSLAILNIPQAGAAIVAGVGILKLAPWGRTWTLVYAILSIVFTLLGWMLVSLMRLEDNPDQFNTYYQVFLLIIWCCYPVILLYLINTKTWKVVFSR